jgi:hypothetical protein
MELSDAFETDPAVVDGMYIHIVDANRLRVVLNCFLELAHLRQAVASVVQSASVLE